MYQKIKSWLSLVFGRAVRRTWQRLFTRLPVRIRPFAVATARVTYGPSILEQPAHLTGVLREEPGEIHLLPAVDLHRGDGIHLDWPNQAKVAVEPARRLFALAPAGLLQSTGMIYEPRGRTLIAETVEQWDRPIKHHRALEAPRLPPPTWLGGTTFVACTIGGESYYHFLIEVLPKLIWAADLLPACDHILIDARGKEWKQRWLDWLGVGARVTFVDFMVHLHCEQAIFTSRLVRHFEPGPWSPRLLRRQAGVTASAQPPETLVWADRSDASSRHAPWEKACVEQLPAFQAVRFHQLTPREVIATCAATKVLAGLHGAALANMVFCQPGILVIEFAHSAYRPWFAQLARSCGHRHVVVMIEPNAAPGEQVVRALAEILGG